MYPKRAFNRIEQDLSRELRAQMEQVEKKIREIGPCRERSIALARLNEALLWANAAIAAAGIERLKTPVGENALPYAKADTIQAVEDIAVLCNEAIQAMREYGKDSQNE